MGPPHQRGRATWGDVRRRDLLRGHRGQRAITSTPWRPGSIETLQTYGGSCRNRSFRVGMRPVSARYLLLLRDVWRALFASTRRTGAPGPHPGRVRARCEPITVTVEVTLSRRASGSFTAGGALHELSPSVLQLHERLLILPIIGCSTRPRRRSPSSCWAPSGITVPHVVVIDITGMATIDARWPTTSFRRSRRPG